MGSLYQSRIYDDCTIAELTDQVKQHCQDAAYENGNAGYTGTWAEKLEDDITFHTKEYVDSDSADRYILQAADKYGSLIAVKFQHGDGTRWLVGARCSN